MNTEQQSILLDYFDILERLVTNLENQKNSVERQLAQYHLRQLALIKIRTGLSEDGPTSLELEMKRIQTLRRLSDLGAETLLTSRKE